jgi:hypothetical protein
VLDTQLARIEVEDAWLEYRETTQWPGDYNQIEQDAWERLQERCLGCLLQPATSLKEVLTPAGR